jgi:uncharacterized protein YegP (UPF0339 family)
MKLKIYKDSKDEWRWSVSAENGNKLADSGEGYKNRKDCEAALEAVTHGELIQMVKNDLQLLIDKIASIQAGHKL